MCTKIFFLQTNYIQQPLPPGSSTGAGGLNGQSGALGAGQQMSTGLTTFYQFWFVHLIHIFCTIHPGFI